MPPQAVSLQLHVDADEATATAELHVNGDVVSGTRRLEVTGHAVADPTAPPGETEITLPEAVSAEDIDVYPTMFANGTEYGALVLFTDGKELIQFDAAELGLTTAPPHLGTRS